MSGNYDNEPVDFPAKIERETDRALLLDFGGEHPEWFPKSQIEDNGNGTFTAPTWLVIEKGVE